MGTGTVCRVYKVLTMRGRAGITVLSCLMLQLFLFLLKNITGLGPTFLYSKDIQSGLEHLIFQSLLHLV